MEKILLIITNVKMNLSKTLDVTDYTVSDLKKTVNAYSVNFNVRVKRYI